MRAGSFHFHPLLSLGKFPLLSSSWVTAAAGGPETCLEFAIYIAKKNRQKYAGGSEVRKYPTYRSTFSELKTDDVLFSILGKDNWSGPPRNLDSTLERRL